MGFLNGLDQGALDGDVGALLAWCDQWLDEGVPIAASGYCMGGRYALTAATLSDRVALAACFHASNIAPEQGESAHLRLTGVKAKIDAGIAEFDPTFDAAEEGRLAAALRAASVDHIIESYAGAGLRQKKAREPSHPRLFQALSEGITPRRGRPREVRPSPGR